VPDAPALVHGDRVVPWRDFERRAARVAGHLRAAGLGRDAKVAFYLHNGPEYLEATFGAFKARCVPVNVNYRYLESELRYLLDNSDAEAVVVSAELLDRLDHVRSDLDRIRTVLVVGADDEHPVPDWALDYGSALDAADPMEVVARSGEDLWFLYTGGTTGMPKGVMWPHRSLLGTAAPTFKAVGAEVPTTVDEVVAAVGAFVERDAVVRLLPAAPLMHGTSAMATIGVLSAGGCAVTLTDHHLDAHELCRTVQDRRVTQLTIVGDAFARPILAALEEAAAVGEPYDLSSLQVIVSSGTIWSRPVKDALLQWCDVLLADLLGSSEGVGFGRSTSRRGRSSGTATFRLGEHAQVFGDDGEPVAPGSGRVGVLAVGGPIPVGYYKDPDKTAETFRTLGGRVWSVPGDHATVEADGTIRLLGRGSVCINTGGEKVYPEEVEEALKLHPAVRDANVVGLPDERWGQSVTALVSLADEASARAADDGLEAELVDHTKQHLAGYKCPKRVVVVERILRGPNGKADYRWATDRATELVS
jgi:fatty-acyl-CoA synthase